MVVRLSTSIGTPSGTVASSRAEVYVGFVASGAIHAVFGAILSLTDAARGHAMLESSAVAGKIVLIFP